jgi:hypothetical protein
VSDVIAAAVAVASPSLVPLVAAPKAVALIVKVATAEPPSAVNVVASCVLDRMIKLPVPPPLTSAVIASRAAFAAIMDITGLVVMAFS